VSPRCSGTQTEERNEEVKFVRVFARLFFVLRSQFFVFSAPESNRLRGVLSSTTEIAGGYFAVGHTLPAIWRVD
jgi:hypothetical protein